MNLDLYSVGWLHFIASLLAIAVAAVVLVRPKGTAAHMRRGRIYVALALLTSITALTIYRLGIFFFPHWFAVAALATTLIGFVAIRYKLPRRGWVHVHLTCMIASVYVLIGGGVNEIFLRIDVLHRLAPNLYSPIVGLAHLTVIVAFAVLAVYFNVRELRRNSSAAA